MKKGKIVDTFLGRDEVTEIRQNQPILDSSRKWMSDAVEQGMKEVMDIFEGPRIKNEDIDLIQKGIEETGLSPEEFREKMLSLPPGQYFVVGGKAFFITADRKCQEASAYVHRLESVTASAFKKGQEWMIRSTAAEVKLLEADRRIVHLTVRLQDGSLLRRLWKKARSLFRRNGP